MIQSSFESLLFIYFFSSINYTDTVLVNHCSSQRIPTSHFQSKLHLQWLTCVHKILRIFPILLFFFFYLYIPVIAIPKSPCTVLYSTVDSQKIIGSVAQYRSAIFIKLTNFSLILFGNKVILNKTNHMLIKA